MENKLQISNEVNYSDRDLKENIQYINYDKLYKAQRINFKSFNFKNDETKRKTYGVIAQEIEELGLLELVHEKEDGYKGVDYISLLSLKNSYLEWQLSILMEEVRNLKHKIDELVGSNSENETNEQK